MSIDLEKKYQNSIARNIFFGLVVEFQKTNNILMEQSINAEQ
jgi:hypothetical protein